MHKVVVLIHINTDQLFCFLVFFKITMDPNRIPEINSF